MENFKQRKKTGLCFLKTILFVIWKNGLIYPKAEARKPVKSLIEI
jgi:hypothetical protein